MLSTIRKFSTSIFAKIFLFIVAVPFVFWGMGPVFTGGSKNVIVKIDDEKISVQEFNNFIRNNATIDQNFDRNTIDKLLSNFIGEKLIEQEIKSFGINLSDKSLSKIIKNEKIFKRDNKFSRIEYEKFLIKNNLNAVTFEANMIKQVEREQLFNFIGGGIVPSFFLINFAYNQINQKRDIELINLNKFFKKKLNFTEKQTKEYFINNKKKFQNIHKSIKFIKLNPENLAGVDDYDDLFFKKVDQIDDLIVEGKNLDFISSKFNLGSADSKILVKSINSNKIKDDNDFSKDFVNDIFKISESEHTVLKEEKNEYFIIELFKTETIQKKITDKLVISEILIELEKLTKRKLLSEIIDKINSNNFSKNDFRKFSKNENLLIKKITINNLNDNKVLKEELIKQIYDFPENRVIVVFDIGLSENYLIYISKIESSSISKNSDHFNKYKNLARAKITSNLYNSYDLYLKNKYEIDINYKALESIKNYIE